MSKFILGPTKGKFDDSEFDIIDNILIVVESYRIGMENLEKEKQQRLEQLEKEFEDKVANLKSDLKTKLNIGETN
jgi:hypothetical protein